MNLNQCPDFVDHNNLLVHLHVNPDRQVHRLGPHRAGIAHFDWDAARKRIGYSGSSGRPSKSFTTSPTASVKVEMMVGETILQVPLDLPYAQARAYSEMILSAQPVQRTCCLTSICGSNNALRSQGMTGGSAQKSP